MWRGEGWGRKWKHHVATSRATGVARSRSRPCSLPATTHRPQLRELLAVLRACDAEQMEVLQDTEAVMDEQRDRRRARAAALARVRELRRLREEMEMR